MRSFVIPDIGEIKLRKSARAKRIILKINHRGEPEVTVPKYVPYAIARSFVLSHTGWIKQQRHEKAPRTFTDGQIIGRQHTMSFQTNDQPAVTSRVQNSVVTIRHHSDLDYTAANIQAAAYKAATRALKKEAEAHLPELLHQLATKHGYQYASVSVKNMRTRWGSCSSSGVINLNIWLMQLPDELIHYVCCHELAHLHHPHHQSSFWQTVATMVPDYKELRSTLKQHHPHWT